MEKTKVKIVNKSGFELPKYATILSAGMDVKTCFISKRDIKVLEGSIRQIGKCGKDAKIKIDPNTRAMFPTGIFIELPEGCEMQVRSRSGLSLKNGLQVVQGVGTIDADYRGECKICIINSSSYPQTIESGDRLAQFVLAKHEKTEWEIVDGLSDTERGSGGFGHTGKK